MSDKEFPKGMFFKLPTDLAPDYIKGKFLIHVQDAIEYLKTIEKEWLSLDAMVSKNGKPYLAVDTWEPNNQRQPEPQKEPEREEEPQREPDEDESSELPF